MTPELFQKHISIFTIYFDFGIKNNSLMINVTRFLPKQLNIVNDSHSSFDNIFSSVIPKQSSRGVLSKSCFEKYAANLQENAHAEV